MSNRHYFQKARKDKQKKKCVICAGNANPDIPGTPFCSWCWDKEYH